MNKYIITFCVGIDEISKTTNGTLEDAKDFAKRSANWPLEFLSRYDLMEVFIFDAEDSDNALVYYSYDEL